MLWRMPADLGRQRIGMMFIGVDDSLGAARSAAAVTTCLHCWRPFHGREMNGGKGAKGGNLESLGNRSPAGAVATRRKPAETGGNCHKPAMGRTGSGNCGNWRFA